MDCPECGREMSVSEELEYWKIKAQRLQGELAIAKAKPIDWDYELKSVSQFGLGTYQTKGFPTF